VRSGCCHAISGIEYSRAEPRAASRRLLPRANLPHHFDPDCAPQCPRLAICFDRTVSALTVAPHAAIVRSGSALRIGCALLAGKRKNRTAPLHRSPSRCHNRNHCRCCSGSPRLQSQPFRRRSADRTGFSRAIRLSTPRPRNFSSSNKQLALESDRRWSRVSARLHRIGPLLRIPFRAGASPRLFRLWPD